MNITARPDCSNTRKSAAPHFTHLSPQLKAAPQAGRDAEDINEVTATLRRDLIGRTETAIARLHDPEVEDIDDSTVRTVSYKDYKDYSLKRKWRWNDSRERGWLEGADPTN